MMRLELALLDHPHRHGGFDGGLEQLLDTGLTQHTAKAPDLRGVARQAWLVVRHAAEELPDHVLAPALAQFFIAEVEGVLEVQQRDHQAQRQARATGVAQARAGELRGGSEEVGILNHAAAAVLVRKHRGQRGLDLGPGHARGQHHQRMAHVDHRVQPGAEKVVGGHRLRSPKLPGNDADWNQSREFAPLAFTPLRQHSCGSSTFCRADHLTALSSKPQVRPEDRAAAADEMPGFGAGLVPASALVWFGRPMTVHKGWFGGSALTSGLTLSLAASSRHW